VRLLPDWLVEGELPPLLLLLLLLLPLPVLLLLLVPTAWWLLSRDSRWLCV
jgi:hypothetical protein